MNYVKLFRGSYRDFGVDETSTLKEQRLAKSHFLLTCRIAATIWMEEHDQQPTYGGFMRRLRVFYESKDGTLWATRNQPAGGSGTDWFNEDEFSRAAFAIQHTVKSDQTLHPAYTHEIRRFLAMLTRRNLRVGLDHPSYRGPLFEAELNARKAWDQ